MFKKLNQLTMLATATASFLLAYPVHAVDTEIYRNLNTVNPNLLFILDSSGSMDGTVITANYDSSLTYSSNCSSNFRSDRVYWSDDESNPPGCGTSQYFPKANMHCGKAEAYLDGASGFYADDFMGWDTNNNYWIYATNSSSFPYYECADDWGFHGQNNVAGALWPADYSAGPWTATEPANGDVWVYRSGIIVYSHNFMNWYHSSSRSYSTKTRLKTVQDVTTNMINVLEDINVGLMHLNYEHGGPVLYPVSDVEAAGVKTAFNAKVDALDASGWTPVTETLYEAMRYYRGEDVVWGTSSNGTASVAGALADSNTYESPINLQCAENNILLLSDGDPTRDSGSDTAINALIDSSGLNIPDCTHGSNADFTIGTQSCLDDLAELLYKTDNSDLDGNQFIKTYTVGFNNDSPLLSLTGSEKTGGQFFLATDEATLQAAFSQIIQEILTVNSSFVTPTLTANAFNRVTHDNSLFYSIFEPSGDARWLGNVKRYELALVNNNVEIVDQNNNVAVDAYGDFVDNAVSFWTHRSIGSDGNNPTVGGLASRTNTYGNNSDFTPSGRNVYTYTWAGNDSPTKNLTDSSNHLSENNSRISKTMLGDADMSDSHRSNLLKWGRGVDVRDSDEDGSHVDGRADLGAPLHSEPVVVTYGEKTINGQQESHEIVYITTNDGFLHAFDTLTTGNDSRMELWSYAPPETLPNLDAVYENADADDLTYGLDGTSDLWIKDSNGDGKILAANGSVQQGDHVYYYFNQRRGGTNTFALDVSDPTRPQYMWTIAANESSTTSPFKNLGQSWSRPRFYRVKVLTGTGQDQTLSTREVIIMGGGYDLDHDNKSTRNSDDKGNSIYILDALTGDVLWWASGPATGPSADLYKSEMKYSIASDIRVIDINGDTIADRFYVSDLGGQLWRFDINNILESSLANRIVGDVIADLQLDNALDSSTSANNRRFFYPPDVALNEPQDGTPYISIAIGSGLRSNPKSTAITDRLYMLKDRNITSPPLNDAGDAIQYTKLYANDLLNVTSLNLDKYNGIVGSNDSLTNEQLEKLDKGWFINLASKEKVLSTALTADEKVFYTTFTPVSSGAGGDVCGSGGVGISRTYVLDVENGGPVSDLNNSGSDSIFSLDDRSLQLQRPGIAASVTIIFPDLPGVKPVPIVGTEIIPVEIDNEKVRTYWYQDNVH